MKSTDILEKATAANAARMGSVIEVAEGGEIGVVLPGQPPVRLRCHVLQTSDRPQLTLALGARVLVLQPAPGEEFGIVLGLVSPYHAPRVEVQAVPATLELVAQQQLQLSCGESSIELHADGRVIVKGQDILSRARRTQKIRGGTVHIN